MNVRSIAVVLFRGLALLPVAHAAQLNLWYLSSSVLSALCRSWGIPGQEWIGGTGQEAFARATSVLGVASGVALWILAPRLAAWVDSAGAGATAERDGLVLRLQALFIAVVGLVLLSRAVGCAVLVAYDWALRARTQRDFTVTNRWVAAPVLEACLYCALGCALIFGARWLSRRLVQGTGGGRSRTPNTQQANTESIT